MPCAVFILEQVFQNFSEKRVSQQERYEFILLYLFQWGIYFDRQGTTRQKSSCRQLKTVAIWNGLGLDGWFQLSSIRNFLYRIYYLLASKVGISSFLFSVDNCRKKRSVFCALLALLYFFFLSQRKVKIFQFIPARRWCKSYYV